MNEADFCKIPGMPHLFAVIDNVSKSEPNLVPGLFYTCSMCRKMLLSRSDTFALRRVVDWYYWMECRKSYWCLVSFSMARFLISTLGWTGNEIHAGRHEIYTWRR